MILYSIFSSILSKWPEVRICIILSVFPSHFCNDLSFYIEGINLLYHWSLLKLYFDFAEIVVCFQLLLTLKYLLKY